jgi:hypothetical protein
MEKILTAAQRHLLSVRTQCAQCFEFDIPASYHYQIHCLCHKTIKGIVYALNIMHVRSGMGNGP